MTGKTIFVSKANKLKQTFLFFSSSYDIRKAFDKIRRERLLLLLQAIGVMDNFTNWLSSRLKSTQMFAVETTHDDPATWQKIKKHILSVPQGSPMSPTLCTFLTEIVGYDLRKRSLGLVIQGEYVGYLSYADNIVLIGNNSNELQLMEKALEQFSVMTGLNNNILDNTTANEDLKMEDYQCR